MSTQDYKDDRDPPDYRLDGVAFLVLYHAKKYLDQTFDERFGGKTWPLEKYNVLTTLYENEGYAAVAFCPKIETFVQGIPFEVADRGIWKNGPGVHLFISLKDYSLLKTTFMR